MTRYRDQVVRQMKRWTFWTCIKISASPGDTPGGAGRAQGQKRAYVVDAAAKLAFLAKVVDPDLDISFQPLPPTGPKLRPAELQEETYGER